MAVAGVALLLLLVVAIHPQESLAFTVPSGQCLQTLESLQFGWSLRNFSRRAERHDIPRRINSPYFPLNPLSETTWHLHIFPPGDAADLRDSLGLYFTLVYSPGKKELSRFRYSIMNSNFRSGGVQGALKEQSPVVTLTPYALWGWPRAAQKEQVSMDLLDEDTLHVVVAVDRLTLAPSNYSSCQAQQPLPMREQQNPFSALEWCESFYQDDAGTTFSWTFSGLPEESRTAVSEDFPLIPDDSTRWYFRMDNSKGEVKLFLCLRQQGSKEAQPLATFNATLVSVDQSASDYRLVRSMTQVRKFAEESNVGHNVYPCWGWNPLGTTENFVQQFGGPRGVIVTMDIATYLLVSRCTNSIPVIPP